VKENNKKPRFIYLKRRVEKKDSGKGIRLGTLQKNQKSAERQVQKISEPFKIDHLYRQNYEEEEKKKNRQESAGVEKKKKKNKRTISPSLGVRKKNNHDLGYVIHQTTQRIHHTSKKSI